MDEYTWQSNVTGGTVLSSFDSLKDWIEATCFVDRVFVLGVCGFSGAGKTTLCRSIGEAYPALTVHFDCDRFSAFNHAERQARIEEASRVGDPAVLEAEENPRHWYAWDAIGEALQGLRSQRAFSYARAWNKKTGMLDETYAISLPQSGPALVLCDGIYLLHPPVRQWLDATLYVEAPFDLTAERGRIRSGNPARATYMERLNRTHALPYFEAHLAKADWIYVEQKGSASR